MKIREYEEKERDRQLRRQKKQGLNQLWLSGKALVTVEDDSDVNDEELLQQFKPQQKQQQQQQQQQQKHHHQMNPEVCYWKEFQFSPYSISLLKLSSLVARQVRISSILAWKC